jgi:hypothetical protein
MLVFTAHTHNEQLLDDEGSMNIVVEPSDAHRDTTAVFLQLNSLDIRANAWLTRDETLTLIDALYGVLEGEIE